VNLGIPPLQPVPHFGINAPISPAGQGLRHAVFSAFGGVGYPVFGGAYEDGYVPMPILILLQQAPAAPAEAPRETARSQMRDYKDDTGTAGETSPGAPQATFSIALRDGTTQAAVAIWVQDNVLHYRTPEGAQRQVAVSAIDRPTTDRVNREKNLTFPLLPPEN
jgi:hypothetical protein